MLGIPITCSKNATVTVVVSDKVHCVGDTQTMCKLS